MEPDNESIDRENYEIINSAGNCPNCGSRMSEQRMNADGCNYRIICPVCQTIDKEIYE